MTRTGVIPAVLLFCAAAAMAQPGPLRELRGQVFHLGEHGEKIFETATIVTWQETGNSDDTNDQGIFRLPIPPAFQPGDKATLSLDKAGWRIRYPLDGEVRIPASPGKEIVAVELLPAGSKLFWTNDRIEKFIQDLAKRSGARVEARESEKKGDRGAEFGRYIQEWAVRYGFTPQDAQKEIDRWIADTEANQEDVYKLGLAAFAKKNFADAARHFRSSADGYARQLAEDRRLKEAITEREQRHREQLVVSLLLEGHSYSQEGNYQKALAAYEEAHGHTSREETPELWAATLQDRAGAHYFLGVQGPPAESAAHLDSAVTACRQAILVPREQFPRSWASAQNNLGTVLREQGTRIEGLRGAQLLKQAIDAYKQALLVYSREQFPQDWASAQNNLGMALREQGVRIEGLRGAQLLEQAIDAHQQALLVVSRERIPQKWAILQNNLGNALQQQATRTEGQRGAQLLEQAIDAYKQALLVFSREQFPQDWARTQNNLGNALREQGTSIAGQRGAQLLEQAVDAYKQALLVRTREQLPQDWAMTQHNLGSALKEQSTRSEGQRGAQLLEQAVDAYKQALLVYSREQLPQPWAAIQDGLGIALQEQGTRTEGQRGDQLLEQAVDAYKQALLVRTREQLPQDWAGTQNHLGTALQEQAARTEGQRGAQLLAQAIDAYKQALLVYSREQLPQAWATIQNNLATALRVQSTSTEGQRRDQLLEQAVDAYRQALLVYSREQFPQPWAALQNNLGGALQVQGTSIEGQRGDQLLEQAVDAYRQALLVRTREQLPQDWATTQYNLGNALLEQGTRAEGQHGDQLLEQAVDAYKQSLLVDSREQFPHDWAMTQHSLGNALFEQGIRTEGQPRAQLFAAAVQAYERTREVYTYEQFPNHWAIARRNEARALLLSGRHREAATAFSEVLDRNPDDLGVHRDLSSLLNDELFDHAGALKVNRQWLARHSDDLYARTLEIETLFASGAYADCKEKAASLLTVAELSSGLRTVVLGYEAAAEMASGSPDAGSALERLVQEVTGQPPGFRADWTFAGALHSLQERPDLPHRDWLVRLFKTLESPDRDAILQGLRALQVGS